VLIEMVTSVSGTCAGYELPPSGHRIDLPAHIAEDLVASRVAVKVPVPVDEEPPVETATASDKDVEERAQPAKRAAKRATKETGG
jgi:hypothetical protein